MIYFICGAGGSGKDTIANDVLKYCENIKRYVTYTNRPMRDGEVDGREYHFISTKKMSEIISSGDYVEYRSYDTLSETWYYMTGTDVLGEQDFLMWGPYSMFDSVKKILNEKCMGILLKVRPRDRALRMIDRAKSDDAVVEACRRIYADSKDFEDINESLFSIVLSNDDGCYEDTLNSVIDFIQTHEVI